MATFSVTFTVEAESLEEAESIVGSWEVTPDATLLSLSGTVASEGPPHTFTAGGSVGQAFAPSGFDPGAPPAPAEPAGE